MACAVCNYFIYLKICSSLKNKYDEEVKRSAYDDDNHVKVNISEKFLRECFFCEVLLSFL